MDDTRCRQFFLEPSETYHRPYEAMRAFFVEGRQLQEIAQVSKADYPGSKRMPASSALLSLLALKLLDKERPSHINEFNFDEAIGLFAGLNIPPKKSYATE